MGWPPNLAGRAERPSALITLLQRHPARVTPKLAMVIKHRPYVCYQQRWSFLHPGEIYGTPWFFPRTEGSLKFDVKLRCPTYLLCSFMLHIAVNESTEVNYKLSFEHLTGCMGILLCCYNITDIDVSGWSKWPNSTVPEDSIHYNDVKMGAMASQITGVSIVISPVCPGAAQRKHQSRWRVNSPHKGLLTRKMFPFDDVIIVTTGNTASCLCIGVEHNKQTYRHTFNAFTRAYFSLCHKYMLVLLY